MWLVLKMAEKREPAVTAAGDEAACSLTTNEEHEHSMASGDDNIEWSIHKIAVTVAGVGIARHVAIKTI